MGGKCRNHEEIRSKVVPLEAMEALGRDEVELLLILDLGTS
jgi:hypothetical protein